MTFGIQVFGVMTFGIYMFGVMTFGIQVFGVMTFGIQMLGVTNVWRDDIRNSNVRSEHSVFKCLE